MFKQIKAIKQDIKKKRKINSYERYEDFVVEQFKNDPAFLKLCLKKSFADYINNNDKTYFVGVLQKATKAHGITKIAKETGLSRQHIYDLCSEKSNPTLENFGLVLKSFGLKMYIKSA